MVLPSLLSKLLSTRQNAPTVLINPNAQQKISGNTLIAGGNIQIENAITINQGTYDNRSVQSQMAND